jgi:hypothetical protein
MENKKLFCMIMFRESDGYMSSNMKAFANEQALSDYIDSELTNHGRKEWGITYFDTWEELVDYRIGNRKILS